MNFDSILVVVRDYGFNIIIILLLIILTVGVYVRTDCFNNNPIGTIVDAARAGRPLKPNVVAYNQLFTSTNQGVERMTVQPNKGGNSNILSESYLKAKSY